MMLARVSIVAALGISLVRADPPVLYYEPAVDARAECYQGLPFSHWDLRPRYTLVAQNGSAATTLLLLGAEAAAAVDWKHALHTSATAFSATLRSEDGGGTWLCGPPVPQALRFGAIPITFSSATVPSCSFVCLTGGVDVLGPLNTSISVVDGACSYDSGRSWQPAPELPANMVGATAVQHGDAIVFIGGLVAREGGSLEPAGVHAAVVDLQACRLQPVQKYVADADLPADLQNRLFLGATFAQRRGRFIVHGGCNASTVPGLGSVLPMSCTKDAAAVYSVANATAGQGWQLEATVDNWSAVAEEEWQPPVIAELISSVDLMQPATNMYVNNTPDGFPGIVLLAHHSAAVAAPITSTYDGIQFVFRAPPPSRSAVNMTLGPPVYKNGVLYLSLLRNGVLYHGAAGICGGKCDVDHWSQPCVMPLAPFIPGCHPCTVCQPGTWTQSFCDLHSDTQCAPCSSCGPGTVPVGGCDGRRDTECLPSVASTALASASASVLPSQTPSVSSSASSSATSSTSASASSAGCVSCPVPTRSAAPSASAIPDGGTYDARKSQAIATFGITADAAALLIATSLCCAFLYATAAAAWPRRMQHTDQQQRAQSPKRRARAVDDDHPQTTVGITAAAAQWMLPALLHLVSWWWHVALAWSLQQQHEASSAAAAAVTFLGAALTLQPCVPLFAALRHTRGPGCRVLSAPQRFEVFLCTVSAVAFSSKRAVSRCWGKHVLLRPSLLAHLLPATAAHLVLVCCSKLVIDVVTLAVVAGDASGVFILLLVVCVCCDTCETGLAVKSLLHLQRLYRLNKQHIDRSFPSERVGEHNAAVLHNVLYTAAPVPPVAILPHSRQPQLNVAAPMKNSVTVESSAPAFASTGDAPTSRHADEHTSNPQCGGSHVLQSNLRHMMALFDESPSDRACDTGDAAASGACTVAVVLNRTAAAGTYTGVDTDDIAQLGSSAPSTSSSLSAAISATGGGSADPPHHGAEYAQDTGSARSTSADHLGSDSGDDDPVNNECYRARAAPSI